MRALPLLLTVATGFGTRSDNDWPPTRFRGVGATQVTFVRTQREIDHLCGKSPKPLTTAACSSDEDGIVLPDPCGYQGEYARIVCHENAHRFGRWPGYHPR